MQRSFFRKHAASLALFSIVFISGCIQLPGGGVGGGGDALVINTFEHEKVIEPNTAIPLTVTIKNVGSKTAIGVIAEIIGLTQDWQIFPGRAQSVEGGTIIGAPRGQTGGEGFVQWDLAAPEKSSTITYPFSVQISYQYATEYDAVIRFVTSDFLRQTGTRGGIISQTNTGGPIQMSVRSAQLPSVLGATVTRIPIIIDVTNSGSGNAFSGATPSAGDLNRLFITSSSSQVACQRSDVRLIGGKSGSITCFVDVPLLQRQVDISVSVVATYNYVVLKSSQITVQARAIQ